MSEKKEEYIDHECTDEIVCPWCGYEFGDSWECGDESYDLCPERCPECGKLFDYSRDITVYYSTHRVTAEELSKRQEKHEARRQAQIARYEVYDAEELAYGLQFKYAQLTQNLQVQP